MTFIQDARHFLEEQLLPRLKGLLSDSEYVHRLIFRENVDVKTARALRELRKEQELDTAHDVLEDRELEKQPYALLLGNAGSGKSFILTFACVQAIQRFLSDPTSPFPLFLDLGNDLPTSLSAESVETALNFGHAGLFERAHTEASGKCVLFLDGLDEALRRSRHFIRDLQFFLQRHWSSLTRVVVACRRAAWSPDWFTTAPIQLTTYHADDLDWEEYAQILPEVTRRQDFFRQCVDLGISALLNTPFDGFYLAREFRDGRTLPSCRRACLGQRVDEALRGRKSDRQDGDAPSVDDLRFLARQLACVGSFTSHTSWTLQEAADVLGTSQVLKAGRPVRPDEVRTLFARGLFKKNGERFAFIHQLYQEYLAAEALAHLPLHKQRQLLEAKRPGEHRVQTLQRGVAIFLAEASESFADYLIGADPLVAFLAEMPSLSKEMDENLLKTVLDDAVVHGRAPWWEIPPRGERPSEGLHKHRPQDVATFLQSYLTSPEQMARIWGTVCAEAWGGAKTLNELLSGLAHDPSQHIEIRKSAVAAIAATRALEAVRGLYNLFDDESDEVRGEVLQAYRHVDEPSPGDFIAKLRGGSSRENLHCLLQVEAENFGHTLAAPQLREAFEAVAENFGSLRNLKLYALRGLFRRAIELRFADVAAGLIVRCWARSDEDEIYDGLLRDERIIKQLLREQPVLFQKVWSHTLTLLENDDDERFLEIDLAQRFADCCTDRIFDLLPPSAAGLTRRQTWLIEGVLTRYFHKEPTADRLAYFQHVAPAFTQHLRLPEPAMQPSPRDPLADKQKLVDALNMGGENPLAQTWNTLLAIAEVEHGSKHHEVTAEDVLRVLERTACVVSARILGAFRACVSQIRYERRETQGTEISMTYPQYETPFWVLRQRGETFALEKVAEVVSCYYGFPSDNTRYEDLLEELRQQDRELWQRCILEVLDQGTISLDTPIHYLIRVQEPIYLSRCRERLELGAFGGLDVGSLLEYLSEMRPSWYREVLRQCYSVLKKRLRQRARPGNRGEGVQDQVGTSQDASELSYWDQFRPLLMLMSDDDDWGWKEFARRLRREDVPLREGRFSGVRFTRVPLYSGRLPVLADWYALIRHKIGQEDLGESDLARRLLESIVTMDGESAIQELRRLQRTEAFPGAGWLSHAIFRIEDRLLSEEGMPWESGRLLDFVNQERLGVVLDGQDLFEWVGHAIEEIQEGLEHRAEGVAGFWNGNQPRPEPYCQNVLWPLLRLTLQRSEISAVEGEEKFIGRNRCDFFVEYPRRGAESFRVGVELKVARKGYGPAELIDPVESQLLKKYLRPFKWRYGIYIVLWFRDNRRYDGPIHWESREEFAAALHSKCEELAKTHQVSLASYVIDLTTPFRER